MFRDELLNRGYRPIQFVDEIGVIAVPAKLSDERAVIPQRALFFSAEALKDLQTVSS
jgi:hypothetical protein